MDIAKERSLAWLRVVAFLQSNDLIYGTWPKDWTMVEYWTVLGYMKANYHRTSWSTPGAFLIPKMKWNCSMTKENIHELGGNGYIPDPDDGWAFDPLRPLSSD